MSEQDKEKEGRWQPNLSWERVTECHKCRHSLTLHSLCILTDRKRNKHPAEGIPKWCPLPKEKVFS